MSPRYLLTLLSLSSSALLAEKTELPKNPMGNLAGEILKLCDKPNQADFTRLLTNNLSADALKETPAADTAMTMTTTCREHGGFQLNSVEPSESGRLVLGIRGKKSEIWSRLIVEADDKGKIRQPDFVTAAPPESSLPKDPSDALIAKELANDVQRLAGLGLFSGIVEVARGTQPIVTAMGGYADRSKKTAFTGSTKFTIASMAKMFTAVAVGQLVDQKKLSFDDTVGKFFPEYPNKSIRDKATIGMLLSHYAGMGNFLDKRPPAMLKNGVKRADEFLPILTQEELQYEPGARPGYSNSGIVLAGAIVEKVSGEDYPVYLRKHIFEPAGMMQSDANNIPHPDSALATPYTREVNDHPVDSWQVAEQDLGSPAGGAISTADDLIRFADALRSGKLVSKATLDVMKTSRFPEKKGHGYGYGMGIDHLNSHTLIGHNGGFTGISTSLAIMLDAPYTVVVLANFDPPIESNISKKAVGLVAAKAK